MIYGYARVSTAGQAAGGNSLEAQREQLKAAGAEIVYEDVFTGASMSRPEFTKLRQDLRAGDTLIVTKLDRLGRSVGQAATLIDELLDEEVTVNVLDGIGKLDTSSYSVLVRHIFLAFAQFERDMILERTREGKELAKQKPGYREGRPKKFSPEQLDHAMDLLDGGNSYTQVVKLTGIGRTTLVNERRRRKK